MAYFDANMHQIRFQLRLRLRPNWGSLERSPQTPRGLILRKREGEDVGEGREEEETRKGGWKGKERGREGLPYQ